MSRVSSRAILTCLVRYHVSMEHVSCQMSLSQKYVLAYVLIRSIVSPSRISERPIFPLNFTAPDTVNEIIFFTNFSLQLRLLREGAIDQVGTRPQRHICTICSRLCYHKHASLCRTGGRSLPTTYTGARKMFLCVNINGRK